MSKAHTNRRKLIATLKRKFPHSWHAQFRVKVDADVKARQGPCIGTLQDLMEAR